MPARTSAFRRILYTDDDLRVSDAERNEVADQLAQHYSDGRLTQDEFDERVSRAMSAKTRSDLAGLFTDLPDLAEPESKRGARVPAPSPARHLDRRPRRHPVLLAVVIVGVLVIAQGVMWHWLTLLVIAAVAVYAIRAVERGRCRRDHTR